MIKSTISKPITFSVYDLMGTFPNEKTAREHFEKVRWKGQPVCPRCNSNFRQYARKSPERVGYFLCKNCNNEYAHIYFNNKKAAEETDAFHPCGVNCTAKSA